MRSSVQTIPVLFFGTRDTDMHYNAMYTCRWFVKRYLDPNKELNVLDVGSIDTDRPERDLTFKRYFRKIPKWKYTGLDIVPGRNVDVVTKAPYAYQFPDNTFDVVISGNTLEHVPDMYQWVRELARLSRGLVFIQVPSVRPEHKHPVDCWRVYPDGMRFLLGEVAGLEVLEVFLAGSLKEDTVGVGRKKLL